MIIHPIDLAMYRLEERMATINSPAERTTDWFLLRAYSTGLTLLKSIKAQGLQDDPVAADNFRKGLRASIALVDGGHEVAPPV